MDFKQMNKKCAECPETSYEKCKVCRVYVVLNKVCELCSSIGGVVPFVKSTAKGLVRFEVCLRCLEKLV